MTSYVIGSDPSCDVVITGDIYVSNRHAHVWSTQDGKVWVEDLGSTNGTYVLRDRGGRLVPEKVRAATEVTVSDQIRVGRTIIPARRTQ